MGVGDRRDIRERRALHFHGERDLKRERRERG
jgi:hypothetical protein